MTDLFHSTVATTNDGQGLAAEHWRSPITDRTGRDALVPKPALLGRPFEV